VTVPERDVYVAIDQGGHATRAVAYDPSGQRLASAFAGVETRSNALGHVEHDGEDLVASVRTALTGLASLVPAGRWLAAGLGVQRSTVACWDRETGAVLAPAISWQDRRHAAWLGQLARSGSRVHALTGLPLSPHYGASKIRWCLDHVVAVRSAADEGRLCAGPLASLLLHRLLDERPVVCDEANASRTQLWSPAVRAWSPELLGMFGIPPEVLPTLAPTEAPFGSMRVDGEAVPLVVCTGDQSAVPFAAGTLDSGSAYVNLGTGAFALRPVAHAMMVPPLLTSVLRSNGTSVDFVLEGTVNGAGAALDWFEEREGLPAERLLSSLDGEQLTPAEAPFFLNGVSGVGSPFWVAGFESRYVGDGEAPERFRAVVESIVFLLRANLDELVRHTGRPRRIVVSGGLSRSGFLCRALAALAEAPIHRLEDPEATASGLAFLAAGQPATWKPAATEQIPPARDQTLVARYLRWLELMREAMPD
jgi:glycerol kinase